MDVVKRWVQRCYIVFSGLVLYVGALFWCILALVNCWLGLYYGL